MRYRWDEAGSRAGVVTLSAEGTPDSVVARTDDFWTRASAVKIDREPWAFRVEQEGLIGALDGRDGLGIERGRIWQSTWRTAGLDGELALTRTTSWLAGKLHFDLDRGGERIAEVLPDGPWM